MLPLISLDRMVSVEPGKAARAIRNVPATLAIFDTHFPRKPVLPGVLILDSLTELAAALLREQGGETWRIAGLSRVRFRHFVQPGDQMELTVELKELTDGLAKMSAAVRVDGKVVTSVGQLRMARDRA